jgi:hypothetical protein
LANKWHSIRGVAILIDPSPGCVADLEIVLASSFRD